VKTANNNASGSNLQRFAFRVSPIAAGCAVLISMSAGGVYAQQAPAAQADTASSSTVVVTGIRKGIEDAISVKKNSTSIVEAISAEDIGKLPDTSIAESIARMPGVAAQRVDGRAQTINFRGMSGDFAGTLLNGREQVSTGDNRGVEFDQYPSELMSGVVLYKTPDASLIGQGLSGTVDLQTVRPLSFGKRTMAVNVRGERNSLGSLNPGVSANGNRVSLSYIDQFANRTFGVAVGFAHLDSPTQQQTFEAWGYPQNSDGQYILGGSKQYAVSSKNKRDGLMTVLQWKPSKEFESMLDMYYSKFTSDTVKHGLEAGTVWGWNPFTKTSPQLTAPPVWNGNFVSQSQWSGVKPVIVDRPEGREDTLAAIGWNNKFNLDKNWTLTGDLSYSRARRKDTFGEFYAGTTGQGDTLTVTQSDGGQRPSFKYGLNYGDPSIIKLVDSGGWGQDGYIKYPEITDKLKSARVDAKRLLESPWFSSVDFGVNYAERSKDKVMTEYQAYLKTSPTTVPANLLGTPADLSYIGIGPVLGFDGMGALNAGLYNLKQNLYYDIYDKNWFVEEKVTTGHVKLDIDSEVGSIPVRGNLGVQIIRADQSSTAAGVVNGVNDGSKTTALSGGKTYTDILPSLNLAFSFANEQTVRVGASRVEARPRMDQMRAAQSYSVDTSQLMFTGSGGNPGLEPWRANAYDLSYEKYFGKKAYVGVTAFYKDLKSYIYDQVVPFDFSDATKYLNTTAFPDSAINRHGTFKQPVNGTGGSVKGIELAASLPFNLLVPMLDGFGVMASASTNESGIESNGPGSKEPLPGLSKWSSNLTLYYEKYGFSARVSQRARGQYVGEVNAFNGVRTNTYIRPEHIVDLQLGYEFETGSYKGLSFLVQVNNLSNAPYETQFGNTDPKLKNYDVYGRTVLFGVNYKM
jgi:iron complex outermembrane recepter protein